MAGLAMIGTTVRQPLHRELGALPGIQWPVTVVKYIYRNGNLGWDLKLGMGIWTGTIYCPGNLD